MNIYLDLFLTFFKIGLFSFGGGASMIPLLQQEVVAHSWLTESALLNFIAVSESTPGPIAINMATFVGSSQAGIFGAICSTLGVVLPSFIIILLIAALFKKFAENRAINFLLVSVRPVVVGMIIAAGFYLALTAIGINNYQSAQIDFISVGLTAVLAAVMLLYKIIFKKSIPVITLILIAAGFGMITALF